MSWADEVKAGEIQVRAELSDPALDDIEVVAEEQWGQYSMWGAWFRDTRTIRLYRPAFDRMEPTEDRAAQVLAVLRHEFAHALGHPGHTGDPMPPPEWFGLGEITIEAEDGWIVTVPPL